MQNATSSNTEANTNETAKSWSVHLLPLVKACTPLAPPENRKKRKKNEKKMAKCEPRANGRLRYKYIYNSLERASTRLLGFRNFKTIVIEGNSRRIRTREISATLLDTHFFLSSFFSSLMCTSCIFIRI